MSNTTPKLFFVFLTLFALLSIAMLYGGIARLRATGTPPFAPQGGLYKLASFIKRPSDKMLMQLDSTSTRVSVWTLVIVVPIASAYLVFAAERPFLGLTLLLLWTSVAAFIGIWIWLHGVFNSLPA